ncbi:MAG: hypothetical protein L0Y66_22995 [Myxococcaceae bacterium]|nr:hypothetical protein [Myxococcaceae bacterium]MCI0673874.1 hypothetical protein [Myxococcaceae bacterium]
MTHSVWTRLRPWGLLLGLAPGTALATPNFPGVIETELGLPSAPLCPLCHQGTPMVGTVVTPFGSSMRQNGLVLLDEDSLRAALAALEQQGVDSDGDGTPDISELRAGEDPNREPGKPGEVPLLEPRYGCSSTGGGIATAALLLLLTLMRGGQRRGPRSSLTPS